MANWLLICDDNPVRRQQCVDHVASRISPVDGLASGSAAGKGWSVVWSAHKSAPVDSGFDGRGGCVVWGHAIDSAGVHQSANDVIDAWQAGRVTQWDGFYAALVADKVDNAITVGTDLLGLFPVYYWTAGDGVSLVATSPQLFRSHPLFKAELDLEGLVGILLTNGLLDNKALWKGVNRLPVGHRIRVVDGILKTEISYAAPTDTETLDLPFRAHVKLLERSLRDAVSRHASPGREYGFMLSGGLDSRLLAGLLADQGTDVHCLTLGRPRDFEMRSAKAVAKALGLSHSSAEIPAGVFSQAAEKLAKWELLSAGFSGVPEWAILPIQKRLPDRTVVGHVADGFVGGIHIGWAYDPATARMDLDVLLPTILAWGFEPDELEELMPPDATHLVESAMEKIREVYKGLADLEHDRAWLYDLQHRQRFHVGSALWTMTFATWPVAPFLDRDVFRTCAALPSSSIADRRAQLGILEYCFPELASLPLDRNSWDNMPYRPRLKHYVLRSINYRLQALGRALRKMAGKGIPDRVYYQRLYDFNSRGWKAVRKMAEPSRKNLGSVLMVDAVDRMWPPPDCEVVVENRIKNTAGARNLAGLAVSTKYLDQS